MITKRMYFPSSLCHQTRGVLRALGLMFPLLMWADSPPQHIPVIHPIASGAHGVATSAAAITTNEPVSSVLVQLSEWIQRSVGAIRTSQLGPVTGSGPSSHRPTQEDRLRGAWQKLRQTTDAAAEVRFRPEHGAAMHVSGRLSALSARSAASPAAVAPPRDTAEQTARRFLRDYRELFLLDDPDAELKLVGDQVDEQGLRTLRFAQQFNQRSVWPAELITRLDTAGNLYLVETTHVPSPHRAVTVPQISDTEAVNRVIRSAPFIASGTASSPELIIYAPLDQAPRLAWKFDLTVGLLSAWTWVVDAVNGTTLSQTSLVADAAVKGSGKDVTGATRALDLWQEGATFYLVDASKSMFDRTSTPPNNGRGVVAIYDGGNKVVEAPEFSSGLVTSANANTGWLPDAVG